MNWNISHIGHSSKYWGTNVGLCIFESGYEKWNEPLRKWITSTMFHVTKDTHMSFEGQCAADSFKLLHANFSYFNWQIWSMIVENVFYSNSQCCLSWKKFKITVFKVRGGATKYITAVDSNLAWTIRFKFVYSLADLRVGYIGWEQGFVSEFWMTIILQLDNCSHLEEYIIY